MYDCNPLCGSLYSLLIFTARYVGVTVITPHTQRERGKVIGLGVLVYIYICLWSKKIFESYLSDRLTFSNIRGRTSRQIYRLVLALLSLETLSSLSK